MSLWYTYPACMAQCSTEYISVSKVGYKPMLNVYAKSIIASGAYVSICFYAYYPYIACPIVQGEGRV